ncbi:hypothetical protein PLICRDRAFT_123648 [Plicaturopsis crispa FD-325 SS-3]|nr:hypothetical protein PLICRDRAFT_123648 [Plicaturopsis crispa FD-325 SS-3]
MSCHRTPQPLPPTPSTPRTASGRKSRAKKRKQPNENDEPGAGPPWKRTKAELSPAEKLDAFFHLLAEFKWSLGELLYHTFDSTKANGKVDEETAQPAAAAVAPTATTIRSRAAHIQHFCNGRGGYGAADILRLWLRHPSGRNGRTSELMYSTTIPYTDIPQIRPALTSFAAQQVKKKLIEEADEAIKPSSGLHASKGAGWSDIGGTTWSRVQGIIQEHQPLTWSLTMAVAAKPPRVRNKVVAVRKNRPADVVSTESISSLNFSRSSHANLLPSARGMLYFGSSAPVDLFRYNSRAGNMPAYTSVHRMLRELSLQEAKVTEAHGRDPNTVGIIRLDNVQNYLRQRDHRVGRQNKLNIGIAATYFEVEGIDPKVLDLDDKRRYLAKNLRKDLTVDKLLSLIDNDHLETIGILQWLQALTRIPELAHMKEFISILYRERAAKQPLPAVANKTHPLASSGLNETVNTELKDALVDFSGQIGQSSTDFLRRLGPIGGDGLTYEKFLLLKEYLQFHDNDFESLETLEPMLEWWHTEWTDLNRVFETHWGPPLSNDPSTLGHSAAKIGRKTPPNLKKVDYYAGTQLAYLILDVRMLDCWRLHFGCTDIFEYFAHLGKSDMLPNFEDLENTARKLFRAYTSSRAQYRAMFDTSNESIWSETVPSGTPWTDEDVQTSSAGLDLGDRKGKRKGKKAASCGRGAKGKEEGNGADEPFKGDRVLARSIAFMRDAMISREAAYATAEGDVGRVYEAMKVMLFTFAGSSHTKYSTYLLETITNLEYECSPELRKALLKMSLVNLTGKPGAFSAGDLVQEYFNRLLEAVGDKKGIEYGADFARNVISRNLHHMARLKREWLDGVGLASRAARHSDPNSDAEVRLLLKEYRERELHSRRPGRSMEGTDVDDFNRGMNNLRKGKLKKWITKTTQTRGLRREAAAPASTASGDATTSTPAAREERQETPGLDTRNVSNGPGDESDGEDVEETGEEDSTRRILGAF